MYTGRDLEELSMIPLSKWEIDELSYYHFVMAQMSPLMNQQGISLHHKLIKEIERRGGLAALDEEHSLS
ncbi:cytosolic protein [Paenactinomyces guangxiensis]|uniref:Cytosolic protein n=1 Tax=Paenactinomyces guangxiensis TaxID=1490290 RepID=A0A7W1WT13_9BACL|nr:cytosolic protein [Paenactinomyces guangxiensis]MBA4495464.1 cytosolic protein [Paenactinomyces guangxiensis]MBH8592413.1 cytosolic protein [Paenactinomyces guangxiensis]